MMTTEPKQRQKPKPKPSRAATIAIHSRPCARPSRFAPQSLRSAFSSMKQRRKQQLRTLFILLLSCIATYVVYRRIGIWRRIRRRNQYSPPPTKAPTFYVANEHELDDIDFHNPTGESDLGAPPLTLHHYTYKNAFDAVKSRMISSHDLSQHYYNNPNSIHYMAQDKPITFLITPTYRRYTQLVDLIRMQHSIQADVLKGIQEANAQQAKAATPPIKSKGLIYWIIIEDNAHCNQKVRELLERTVDIIPFAHVHSASPAEQDHSKRGRTQRNLGLEIIQERFVNAPHNRSGVVYFADDDNGYDAKLFDELRKVQRVGTWPVGYVGKVQHERCRVNETTGKVEELLTGWPANRTYPLDMGAFGFHTRLFAEKPHIRFDVNGRPSYSETDFMELLINHVSDLEPLAENCTKVYVYHIKSTIGTNNGVLPSDPLDSEINLAI